MSVASIQENLNRVEEQITAACRLAARPRSEVTLMAVSKTHPAASIMEALDAGLTVFGENRVQEFQGKSDALYTRGLSFAGSDGPEQGPRTSRTAKVHLIGKLQSNKSAKAAEIFSAVDSLDSLKLAQRLQEAAHRLGRKLPVLLELKLSHEETKTGLGPESPELEQLLEQLPGLPNLTLKGLMTVPPWSEDPETARPYFAELRRLRDKLSAEHQALDFSVLSMGMSSDFAVAIEEGSTCIRIGTALFGKRPYPAKPEEP